MVYIVSYDLRAPGQRYDELIELIKKDGSWAKLGESAYLIESNASATELRDRFKPVLDGNDRIYVGQVKTPAAWSGMTEGVSNWIKKKL